MKVAENVAKQNARRAALKATETKRLREAACSSEGPLTAKKAAGTRVVKEPGRLLDTVAAFWERKKARASTDLPS